MAEDSKLAKWTDAQKDWKGYAKQIKGFKIRNKDLYKILETPDPRKRDRVTTRYQVHANEHADPTGARPGEWVNTESETVKARKDSEHEEADQTWHLTLYDSIIGTKHNNWPMKWKTKVAWS